MQRLPSGRRRIVLTGPRVGAAFRPGAITTAGSIPTVAGFARGMTAVMAPPERL